MQKLKIKNNIITNKFFLVFFLLTILFLFSNNIAYAQECDESLGGGLVPCGRGNLVCKVTISGGGFTAGQTIDCGHASCVPGPAAPNGASGCVASLNCRCELYHVFILILNVYKFVVWKIAIPLAGLLIMIGGIMLLIGGGYPKLHDTGKRILWGSVWGIVLILSSWLIINLVMMSLGYQGGWFVF